MGVLPLMYKDGQTADSLGLSGEETFDFILPATLKPREDVTVRATARDGTVREFVAQCRIDTPVEIDYYKNGGILQTVLRGILAKGEGVSA